MPTPLPDGRMRAMRIHRLGPVTERTPPLSLDSIPIPAPATGELLLRVTFCGVCRTELDEIEGRTPPHRLPMTPGHQVIGTVVARGDACRSIADDTRVGVAWIHSACGSCDWCARGLENLCPQFSACGRDAQGGYAQYMTVPEAFAHPLPESLDDAATAPLLCAGAVGLRALRLCALQSGGALGLTGFGASGHLVLQMARLLHANSPVFVFARNPAERRFALELGADWAGDTHDRAPQRPLAMIDTTPAWEPVLAALDQLAPGGRLVVNAISKEAGDRERLLELDYDRHLWREKTLTTVANVTRRDVRDCLDLAAAEGLRPEISLFPLEEANRALQELKAGQIRGAKVLAIA
jgi:propanol-preferring alcohol dehydrogenase